jgi:hypothetical protein
MIGKNKKLIIIGTSYFATIIAFGFIYWFSWLINPSNFIVNPDYNEHTIRPFYFHGDLETV